MTDKIIIDGVDVSGCFCLDEWKHCDICQTLIKTIDKGDGEMRSQCITEKDLRCEFYPSCYYKQLKRKEEECEKWKSYYDLYRQDQTLLTKIQGVINSHPKYGVELTETGIIAKDERISYLEIDEQIKLIFTEYEADQQKVKEAEQKAFDRYISSNMQCVLPSNCLFVNKYKQALEEIKRIALRYVEAQGRYEILQKCEVLDD